MHGGEGEKIETRTKMTYEEQLADTFMPEIPPNIDIGGGGGMEENMNFEEYAEKVIEGMEELSGVHEQSVDGLFEDTAERMESFEDQYQDQAENVFEDILDHDEQDEIVTEHADEHTEEDENANEEVKNKEEQGEREMGEG